MREKNKIKKNRGSECDLCPMKKENNELEKPEFQSLT